MATRTVTRTAMRTATRTAIQMVTRPLITGMARSRPPAQCKSLRVVLGVSVLVNVVLLIIAVSRGGTPPPARDPILIAAPAPSPSLSADSPAPAYLERPPEPPPSP
eukprot:COSAG02_NODE_26581_length_630_cov_0.681733_1_plen_105_part_01